MLIHRVDQQNSEVPTAQSVQQHHLDSIFMVCSCTTTTSPCVVFTVVSMLLFVDQRTVSVSNMDLMSGSMVHSDGSFIDFSVPAAGGQHGDFCEEGAEEDAEGCESRLPRMLWESEGG